MPKISHRIPTELYLQIKTFGDSVGLPFSGAFRACVTMSGFVIEWGVFKEHAEAFLPLTLSKNTKVSTTFSDSTCKYLELARRRSLDKPQTLPDFLILGAMVGLKEFEILSALKIHGRQTCRATAKHFAKLGNSTYL